MAVPIVSSLHTFIDVDRHHAYSAVVDLHIYGLSFYKTGIHVIHGVVAVPPSVVVVLRTVDFIIVEPFPLGKYVFFCDICEKGIDGSIWSRTVAL